MHALGFYHEHTRADRGNYVDVNNDNIISNNTWDYTPISGTTFGLPYDFYSVMHYHAWAFGISGQQTMWSKCRFVDSSMFRTGNRNVIS